MSRADRPIEKIAVIGAGVVGVPMAALLADARIGAPDRPPARVVIVQRASPSSGWKVAALNAGRNPLGGIEPGLEERISRNVAAGILRASSDMSEARDAGAILVCVQTDRSGGGPDYTPLGQALDALAAELIRRPPSTIPLVILESTLAPTSLTAIVGPRLAERGLVDGRDIDLGFSPNRVMPGCLIERIRNSDKIISGLRPQTAERIRALYGAIVANGRLHAANPMTAETVKTLENASRDVRIAFAAETARFCDERDIDFHALRAEVNARLERRDRASADTTAVPVGGLLVPTCGVGGHCLPKDGILLLWRKIEAGLEPADSLILTARSINDSSPNETAARIERVLGPLTGLSVALLGAAYRPGAADTRNSPALALGRLLRGRCRALTVHDPYVRPDDPRLAAAGLADVFSNDFEAVLSEAELAVAATAHPVYREERIGEADGPSIRAIFDAAHLFRRDEFAMRPLVYEGIGKGRNAPPAGLIETVELGFRAVERGLANETAGLIGFLNERFAAEPAERVDFETVRALAATCATGCVLDRTGPVGAVPRYPGFQPRLPACAALIPAGPP